ncbi:hypothetical protein Ctob_003735 [Chrysochromulina tobinii]|uniref:Uncharacterized protein n=1 Tax=Chrysochromulina tobinii TaxID=1460289 RepID=A0A0M0JDK0_9EUKA|nr:hypothetical protein Ctob_003735 [Chrysochromulina tobinii]|eukprot:KOO24651.1 hypothetical protein Ctob_003735 [Chrysochromulina sp. CCMP291]
MTTVRAIIRSAHGATRGSTAVACG